MINELYFKSTVKNCALFLKGASNMAEKFYDELAEEYHLIFEDWERSISRQGDVLDNLLSAEGIKKT